MTSIEWLLSELEKVNYHPTEAMIMYAKKLEKQQIIDAYNKSFELRDKPYSTADKYYTSTYGSKGSDDHIVDTNEMVEDTYKVWECCGMENCICKGSDETKTN